MKRFLSFVFAAFFVFSAVATPLSYAAGEYRDTPIDQAGDWFATLGKKGLEKDQILAQRKADRMARYAEKLTRQAAKEAEKAGQDTKKKLGF